jgi:hypothetical protein
MLNSLSFVYLSSAHLGQSYLVILIIFNQGLMTLLKWVYKEGDRKIADDGPSGVIEIEIMKNVCSLTMTQSGE